MIDTGANVSLIDVIELNKILEEGKKHILTLPISNIVRIGATGSQYTKEEGYILSLIHI